ncbi:MAG: isopentenyl transferase family protein [Bacillota bacterium]|nr:isopentenyl transferase family protein [Bacillota bacterium]
MGKKVILIGGSPTVGKSTIAMKLASEYGYNCISTDDIGEVLQTVTDINPMKNMDYREYYIKKSIDELINDVEEYHSKIWPAIKRLIDIHSDWSTPIIIEGWALYPRLLKSVKADNMASIWLVGSSDLFRERLIRKEKFYSGASHANLLIDNYIKRSNWHNSKIKKELDDMEEEYIMVTKELSIEKIFEKASRILDIMGSS